MSYGGHSPHLANPEAPIHRATTTAATTAAAVLLLAACGAPPQAGDLASGASSAKVPKGDGSSLPDDYNGDGLPDHAIEGAQGDQETGERYVGAVFGGKQGLDGEQRVVLTREALGLPAPGEDDPGSLTIRDSADLDGDGFADLLIDADGAYVVWGGPEGLAGKAQALPAFDGKTANDMLAVSTAVADFDGDGATDIAVLDQIQGSPQEDFETAYLRGPFDRDGKPSETADLTLPDDAQDADLAPIDADGDKAIDLALVRNNDESPARHLVLRSGSSGPAEEELGDTPPGHAYATGDFDKDGTRDLLIGANGIPNNENPNDPDDPELHPGYVDFYSGADGFAKGEPVRITRDTPGVPGKAADSDGFGNGLLVGDVNGDGYDDAAVFTGTGFSPDSVNVLLGGPDGLTGKGAANLPLPDAPAGDLGFWDQLNLRDYDGDDRSDLLLGTEAPGRGNAYNEYAVHAGTPDGVTAEPSQEFSTKDF
ncbi:hypothetical protein CLV63_10637 [Murinocardiopsis flavida]|uniref:VCBS repeat protein n=1 Tax=Murinocardiopsis flavida TaxID=645275 RepID=A0A2P8DLA2_9ACTN|nr:VCBS repeat-containing protein [Murinocardiopsis flavida]PSK97989.1 hypothetical protein CLV63_10637 [Murinocardiopsis flavida]